MITKERLEETIRGVIREFRQTKQIPEPVASQLTAALEERVENLFDQESNRFSYKHVANGATYVSELRDELESKSAHLFLQEIIAWQQLRS